MADGHRAESPIAVAVLAEDEPLDKALVDATARVAASDGEARIFASLRRAVLAALASQRDVAGEALRAAIGARGTDHEGELELTTAL
ncbi:MAG: hypothetical protein M3Y87_32310, partial [Myxococcota bacterium]|nr:hypothetical protein [Myxococcota bacterium]